MSQYDVYAMVKVSPGLLNVGRKLMDGSTNRLLDTWLYGSYIRMFLSSEQLPRVREDIARRKEHR